MSDRPWLCSQGDTCPCKRTHDTYSAYRYGCRSGAARQSYRRYIKQLRANINPPRMVPAFGTARRLRALSALGWPLSALAAELGTVRSHVGLLRQDADRTVSVDTAQQVADLYERLAMRPGGDIRARNYALRQGWAPPLCFDDIDDPREKPKFGEDETGRYRRRTAGAAA